MGFTGSGTRLDKRGSKLSRAHITKVKGATHTDTGAHGIIIVYDITDIESFKAIENWMGEVDKFASANVNKLLIGNKADLAAQRKVSHEQGLSLAKQYGIRFLETSAKTCTNVMECFNTMTEEIYQRVVKGVTPKSEGRGVDYLHRPHSPQQEIGRW